jgi:hypothetical protein
LEDGLILGLEDGSTLGLEEGSMLGLTDGASLVIGHSNEPAPIKSQDGEVPSYPSAIAMLITFVCPALTHPVARSTLVNPFISASAGLPGT